VLFKHTKLLSKWPFISTTPGTQKTATITFLNTTISCQILLPIPEIFLESHKAPGEFSAAAEENSAAVCTKIRQSLYLFYTSLKIKMNLASRLLNKHCAVFNQPIFKNIRFKLAR